ncbi:MAG: hypothetical protein EBU66_19745, partial [Bacteroidetes bacterium]|nr:hypothetical protein [Bacteroidota bacterium]
CKTLDIILSQNHQPFKMRLKTLMHVLGLDFKKTFDNTPAGDKEFASLRYGAIAGLTDQDLDGFNIFGLLATYFLTFWPNLVRRGFIKRIQTPLVRIYPKTDRKLPVIAFYSMTQLNKWRIENADVADSKYRYEYYKGLASHDEGLGEVKSMFANIDKKICLYTLDEQAIKQMYIYYGTETIDRKKTLATNVSRIPVEGLIIPLSQHFEIDSKLYQRDNIIRKLLSCIDGMVISRRKILYTARKHGRSKIKVAGLASETVSNANYHHGENSLCDTITKMAQAYPCARNLPLLIPLGSFGSRSRGYTDYGQPRYTHTKLNSKLVDLLFRKEDDYVLEYELEEGKRYEPKYYVPIIPYALCETTEIPATGWNINVQARHIDDIIKNTVDMIKGKIKRCGPLRPWNKDFAGEIRIYKKREYAVGRYEYDMKTNKVEISELPIGMYASRYCFGNEVLDEEKKKKTKKTSDNGISEFAYVEDVVNRTTDDGVNIIVELKEGAYDKIKASDSKYGNSVFDPIEDYLKLKRPIYHRLNLLNQKNEVVEFKTYEDIFNTWFEFRKQLYSIRTDREIILNDLMIAMLKNMQRFSQKHDSYKITKSTSTERFIEILVEEK